jgi:enoyl-CoA hydratase
MRVEGEKDKANTMTFETILFQEEENVAIITLNRPKRLNALNLKLLEELNEAIEEIDSKESLRVVVVTGGEKVFCAGADINVFSGLTTPEEAYSYVQKVKHCLGSLRRTSKPVIAGICGYALGGGFELSLFCDIRFASDDAQLGVPEINLGAFPAAGGTQMLPRLIGPALAKEMLLGGDPISAKEAYRIGLVNKIFPREKVLDESLKMAKVLATKPAFAIRAIKRVVDNGLQMDLDHAFSYESSHFLGIWASYDFKEGTQAFLEKRKPNFKGK